MNQSLQKIFNDFIKEQGKTVVKKERTFKSYMADLLKDYPAERNISEQLSQLGILYKLASPATKSLGEGEIARYADELVKKFGVDKNKAIEVIRMWAVALGVDVPKQTILKLSSQAQLNKKDNSCQSKNNSNQNNSKTLENNNKSKNTWKEGFSIIFLIIILIIIAKTMKSNNHDHSLNITGNDNIEKQLKTYEEIKKIDELANMFNFFPIAKINCYNGDNPEYCFYLGSSYLNGKDVEQNVSKAIEFFKIGCSKGNKKSCHNLGVLYDNDKRVKQDYSKAVIFYNKACNMGMISDCYRLGFLYYKGQGTDKNYHKAKELWKKACDGGDMIGCNNLGILYVNGQGVEKNYNKAKELWEKACNGGYENACKNMKIMESK